MNDLYETKISDARWWAYDIPGNIGWITYIAVMVFFSDDNISNYHRADYL